MKTIHRLYEEAKASTDSFQKKRKLLEEDRINRQFEEYKNRTSSEENYQPFSLENRKRIDLEAASHEFISSLADKLPFITPELSELIPVSKGMKYLIGAISGTGKTTMGAAMTYEVMRHSKDSMVLYISNEEREDNFLFRLGCMELGIDINDYKYGRISESQRKQMVEAAERYQDRVIVEKSAKSSSVNGVMEILNTSGVENFSLVIVDYYQGIHRMNELDNPAATDQSRTSILDSFKQKITDLDVQFPLVLLTQLKPLPMKEEDRNIEGRIKWGTSIYEACDWVFEAINIKKMGAMSLFVQKARWGQAFQTYHCKYDRGRYISLSDDEFTEYLNDKKLSTLDASLTEKEPSNG